MRTAVFVAFVTACLIAGVAGQTRRTQAGRPAAERAVPFAPGETLAYDISWGSFVTAATATVTVRDKRPSFDSVAYYIVAEGRPTALVSALYRLYYKADTLLDAFTLLPQRGSLYSQEGGRERLRAIRFDQPGRKVTYEVQTGTPLKVDNTHTMSVPEQAHDPLSAIYALRAMELKPGARFTMPVLLNDTLYRVQFTVGPREEVTSGIGTMSAWKITPVVQDARGPQDTTTLALWISADTRRLPLLMDAQVPAGHFKLTLRSVGVS